MLSFHSKFSLEVEKKHERLTGRHLRIRYIRLIIAVLFGR